MEDEHDRLKSTLEVLRRQAQLLRSQMQVKQLNNMQNMQHPHHHQQQQQQQQQQFMIPTSLVSMHQHAGRGPLSLSAYTTPTGSPPPIYDRGISSSSSHASPSSSSFYHSRSWHWRYQGDPRVVVCYCSCPNVGNPLELIIHMYICILLLRVMFWSHYVFHCLFTLFYLCWFYMYIVENCICTYCDLIFLSCLLCVVRVVVCRSCISVCLPTPSVPEMALWCLS